MNIRRKENLSYPIHIEEGLFHKIPQIVAAGFQFKNWGSRVAIVTDTNIAKRFGKELLAGLQSKHIPAELFFIPSGESHKTLASIEKLAEAMVRKDFKRDTLVIGLGGGVVLDLAGFLASIYMRGTSHIAVPTTLLAMADASIGGKTGVDLASGKNLLGTFHQPRAVYIDPLLLQTLPEKEFKNGLAEIIKHGIIGDRGLFRLLEKKHAAIIKRDPRLLQKMLYKSCTVKQKIVEEDEQENGRRMLLNYGHTIGHAIEKATKWHVPHGYAVAMGIALENRFFMKQKLMDEKLAQRIFKLLNTYQLPTELPHNITVAALLRAAMADKKIRGDRLSMALPIRIGKTKIINLQNARVLFSVLPFHQ